MTNPKISDNGTKFWFNKNRHWHREDGPALIYNNGDQAWYINNFRHRDNKSFQSAAGISDEDMIAIVLKYGNVE
jgi:hypothetical protein